MIVSLLKWALTDEAAYAILISYKLNLTLSQALFRKKEGKMVYTVGEMARLLNVPASTLRYYDKEGLLPFVERSSGGIRMFKDSDYEWLQVIGCLKKAGMSIRDIRQYILLAMQGDSTINERLQMFYAQRERLLEQMDQLQQTLNTLNYKCWFYEQAKERGSTKDVPCIVPEEYRGAVRRLRDVPLAKDVN